MDKDPVESSPRSAAGNENKRLDQKYLQVGLTHIRKFTFKGFILRFVC